jgi:hypothetical protein
MRTYPYTVFVLTDAVAPDYAPMPLSSSYLSGRPAWLFFALFCLCPSLSSLANWGRVTLLKIGYLPHGTFGCCKTNHLETNVYGEASFIMFLASEFNSLAREAQEFFCYCVCPGIVVLNMSRFPVSSVLCCFYWEKPRCGFMHTATNHFTDIGQSKPDI